MTARVGIMASCRFLKRLRPLSVCSNARECQRKKAVPTSKEWVGMEISPEAIIHVVVESASAGVD